MIRIRKAEIEDHQHLIELLRLNTPKYFSSSEESDFANYLINDAENYFVIEDDLQIVGCGGFNFWDEGKTARISWDIFHPESQDKGYGSKLTRFRLQKIRENLQVETIVVRTSQLVYGFYEKFGFKTTNIIKDYWDFGFDLYYMEQDV